MCYRVELKMGIKEIGKRFKAVADNPNSIVFDQEINGFSFSPLPVITCDDPAKIQLDYCWGLVPHWCKDDAIRKNTLNARIESLHEKPAFRDAVANRCLILVTGYFEWRWNDDKGKSKQKFEVHHQSADAFAFGGLFSRNQSPAGVQTNTFTIVTTQANETMQYVHNTKQRMPLIINPGDEMAWLDSSNDASEFSFPGYDAKLVAFAV